MDSREKELEHIHELNEKFKIKERYENTLTQIQDVLEALGLIDKVTVSTKLLGQAILDYFEDINRLKEFEGIEKANVDKIYGYQTFWLLRNKPIQIIDKDIEYKYLHINEKVFSMILISKMLAEAGVDYDDVNPRLLSFMKLVYYNFKYRIYTQQSLELIASAFFCGCAF